MPLGAASAKTKFKVVYSFCVDGTCSDGQNPNSTPVGDDKGNVYGTVGAGGAQGSGGVYRVQPNGTETLLYSFCSLSVCTDGSNPGGGLILDTKGNLYGTTIFGGTGHQGIVYKLSRAKQTPWKLTVLYNFCSKKNCNRRKPAFFGPDLCRKRSRRALRRRFIPLRNDHRGREREQGRGLPAGGAAGKEKTEIRRDLRFLRPGGLQRRRRVL